MRIAMQDLPRLAYYYLKCGFTKEMFVTMLVYASEHNADNVAYLFRICEKWIELGIDSIEKAIDWKMVIMRFISGLCGVLELPDILLKKKDIC